MTTRPPLRAAAAALVALTVTGCVAADEAPDLQGGQGVPIVGDDGRVVGTADADELADLGENGTVDVFDDGQRVGSFSPSSGFSAVDDAS